VATLSSEISSSQDAPVDSVKRTVVATQVGHISNFVTEDSLEEWQSLLRSLQQWICELLIKNQQLRLALMEMKELEPKAGPTTSTKTSFS
jgi:hypothetical protein